MPSFEEQLDMPITCEVHAVKNVFGVISAYVGVIMHGIDVRRKTFAVANVGTKHYDPEATRHRTWAWVGSEKSRLLKALEANDFLVLQAKRRKQEADEKHERALIVARWVCAEVHRVRRLYGMGSNRMRGGYVNVYGMMTDGDA